MQLYSSELDKYITELRARGVCVSSFMIKVEAMRILRLEAEQRNTELKFRASDGWFSNFIKRKKFSLRRITTSGSKNLILRNYFSRPEILF